MDEQLQVLKLVARRLSAANIPYMITGSIAMSYYAQPRLTRDIDIVVELQPSAADRVAALFDTDFYCDRDGLRRAAETRRMANLIHTATLTKLDLIVRKDSEYRRVEFERRQKHDLDGDLVWLVSPEDLLLSKLVWAKDSGSELQMRDARNLASAVPGLDWTYVDRWAQQLSVTSLLADVRR